MIDPEKDISNLDFPVAGIVREALSSLSLEQRQELLNLQVKMNLSPAVSTCTCTNWKPRCTQDTMSWVQRK